MATVDQIVKVNISQQTSAVAQASFSIPAIFGPTNAGWAANDYIHTYSSPAGMLTDGFTTASPEYIAASAMYAQSITPTVFKVARRGGSGNRIDVLSVPTPAASTTYTLDLLGGYGPQTFTTTSTAPSALTLLGNLLSLNSNNQGSNIISAAVSGTGNAAVLTITSSATSAPFTASNNITVTTPNAGGSVTQDLANAMAQDNTWYGIEMIGITDADILLAAAWVESNKKLLIATTSTAAVATNATNDVASALKSGAFNRTGLFYSPNNVARGLGAALLGSQLAQTPGSNSWAFKTLAGMSADNISASQASLLIGTPLAGLAGKNANIYQSVGGVNITQMGTAGSGQFFDITVGLDWLQSTIQTNIYQVISNAPKVPYTDVGAALLAGQVQAALNQGITNGLIDGASPVTVSVQKVASVSITQRANRIAPTITFSARLQGAIHAVQVNGTVTV